MYQKEKFDEVTLCGRRDVMGRCDFQRLQEASPSRVRWEDGEVMVRHPDHDVLTLAGVADMTGSHVQLVVPSTGPCLVRPLHHFPDSCASRLHSGLPSLANSSHLVSRKRLSIPCSSSMVAETPRDLHAAAHVAPDTMGRGFLPFRQKTADTQDAGRWTR